MKAVFFDMDGLIFDTETLGLQLSVELAKKHNIDISKEEWLSTIGITEKKGAEMLSHKFPKNYTYWHLHDDRAMVMKNHMENQGIPIKKGAEELLLYLKEGNIPTALVTSSSRKVVDRYFALTSFNGYFDKVVTGDLVTNSKPHPEIYLLAAKKLGVDPRKGIALEDSYNGLKAAKGAGMLTIMVPDLIPYGKEIAPYVDEVYPSLDKVIPFIQEKQRRLKGEEA